MQDSNTVFALIGLAASASGQRPVAFGGLTFGETSFGCIELAFFEWIEAGVFCSSEMKC